MAGGACSDSEPGVALTPCGCYGLSRDENDAKHSDLRGGVVLLSDAWVRRTAVDNRTPGFVVLLPARSSSCRSIVQHLFRSAVLSDGCNTCRAAKVSLADPV